MHTAPSVPPPIEPVERQAESRGILHCFFNIKKSFLASPLPYVVIIFLTIALAGFLITFKKSQAQALLNDSLQAFGASSQLQVKGTLAVAGGTVLKMNTDFTLEHAGESAYVRTDANFMTEKANARLRTELISDSKDNVYFTFDDIGFTDAAVEQSNPAEALRILRTEAALAVQPQPSWLRFARDDLSNFQTFSTQHYDVLDNVFCVINMLDMKSVNDKTKDAARLIASRATAGNADPTNGIQPFYLTLTAEDLNRFLTQYSSDTSTSCTSITSDQLAQFDITFWVNREARQLQRVVMQAAGGVRVAVDADIAYRQLPKRNLPSNIIDLADVHAAAERQSTTIDRRIERRLEDFPVLNNILRELQADRADFTRPSSDL